MLSALGFVKFLRLHWALLSLRSIERGRSRMIRRDGRWIICLAASSQLQLLLLLHARLAQRTGAAFFRAAFATVALDRNRTAATPFAGCITFASDDWPRLSNGGASFFGHAQDSACEIGCWLKRRRLNEDDESIRATLW
jgi:hypothetical protein